jgi:hypothetical protein
MCNMKKFTVAESARIQYEMNRRRRILWKPEAPPVSPEREKRHSERLERFRKFIEDRPASVVEAWHYNRCFPPEEDLSQDGNTLSGLHNGSYTPAPV